MRGFAERVVCEMLVVLLYKCMDGMSRNLPIMVLG